MRDIWSTLELILPSDLGGFFNQDTEDIQEAYMEKADYLCL